MEFRNYYITLDSILLLFYTDYDYDYDYVRESSQRLDCKFFFGPRIISQGATILPNDNNALDKWESIRPTVPDISPEVGPESQ